MDCIIIIYIERLHFDYVEIETFMGFMLKQTAQESIKVLHNKGVKYKATHVYKKSLGVL